MQSNREFIIEPVGMEIESLPRPIDWHLMFGNGHPVEIEIGIGKGTFLTDQAKTRPEINFFGIEWARWFWRYASDRLRRNECLNVRTARAEALFFVTEHVSDASVSILHIYFPDPWPKARHHKRRLIQEPFLKQARRILIAGGRLQIVTDHLDYFEQIDRLLRASPGFAIVQYDRPESAAADEFVGTNFERKYRREGRPFYSIAAIKQD